MAPSTQLSILIPVFNERKLLPQLLKRVHAALPDLRREIVIVDDCSQDGTRDWLREAFGGHETTLVGFTETPDGEPKPILRGAGDAAVAPNGTPVVVRTVFHAQNQGKGAALRTALQVASGGVMVVQDADLEYDPSDLVPMWKLIAEGHADVVYGSRFYGRPHRCLNYHHFLANKLISFLFSVLYNQILSDLEVCYKMFRREVGNVLTLRSNDFGFEIEFSANVARESRLRIYEVGVSYYGRSYAEGKKINWRDGLKALWYIFRFRFS
jgi:glycosyltransferase involved in cell wall biosynthesis